MTCVKCTPENRTQIVIGITNQQIGNDRGGCQKVKWWCAVGGGQAINSDWTHVVEWLAWISLKNSIVFTTK